MTVATNGVSLVEKIRQEVTKARQAGDPVPGRPTLARMFDTTEHQVRKVLAELEPPAATPPADGAETTAELLPAVTSEPQPEARKTSLPKPWPLVPISLAAMVAVWGGWVRLGELTGFGPINLLPGIGNGLTVNTAVVLPLSVEFYAAYALRVVLASGELSKRTKRFGFWSVMVSLGVGMAAQVASHVMGAAGVTMAPAWVTTLVACVPVLVVGLATGLATLVGQDAGHSR